jgi:hypothetical protein
MIIGVTIVHEAVEGFAAFGTVGTPPEPASVCFVEGTPEDGDTSGLKTQELHGDGVQIAQEEGVIGAGGVERGG